MPIDPYAALNAMIRAEVTRFTPPPRTKPKPEPKPEQEQASEPEETAAKTAAPATAARETAALSRSGSPVPAAAED
ncbi:hypothetical protein [Streptomyces sp. NPDC090445]|uniref:hypothetical protein n=1 Tax=Streptomyces sp. NPDC090445 TaxID=3365963 RepID=UPI0037FA2BA7